MSTYTYDVVRDETTVWVWGRTSPRTRFLGGPSEAWRPLFRIRGRAEPARDVEVLR